MLSEKIETIYNLVIQNESCIGRFVFTIILPMG